MTDDTTSALPAGAREKTAVRSIKCKYFADGSRNKYKTRLTCLSLSPEDDKIFKEANDSGKERAGSRWQRVGWIFFLLLIAMLRMAQITNNSSSTRNRFNSTSTLDNNEFAHICSSNSRMFTVAADGSDAQMLTNANDLNGTHTVSHHGPYYNLAQGEGLQLSQGNPAPAVPGQASNRHTHGNPAPAVPGQASNRHTHGNPAPAVPGQALNRHPYGNPAPAVPGQALNRRPHGNPAPAAPGQALNRPSNGNPAPAAPGQVLDASPTENAITRFRSQSSNVIVLVYVDDCIIIGQDNLSIDLFIESLTHGPEKFAFTDEGSIDKYLGVNIERLPENDGFTISQPHLIQRILEAAQIDLRMTNSRLTPDEDGPDGKHEWKYRTLTGMLEYLQITSRPDISMATHQCARFNANPKLCHERALKWICKYLLVLGTIDKGLIKFTELLSGKPTGQQAVSSISTTRPSNRQPIIGDRSSENAIAHFRNEALNSNVIVIYKGKTNSIDGSITYGSENFDVKLFGSAQRKASHFCRNQCASSLQSDTPCYTMSLQSDAILFGSAHCNAALFDSTHFDVDVSFIGSIPYDAISFSSIQFDTISLGDTLCNESTICRFHSLPRLERDGDSI
eukprot:scaffold4076_cov147-Skeletonema_marinoi.AAC.1